MPERHLMQDLSPEWLTIEQIRTAASASGAVSISKGHIFYMDDNIWLKRQIFSETVD